MRVGHLPGRADMLKQALAFAKETGERRATRRALIAGMLGLPVVAGGAYFMGRAEGTGARAATAPDSRPSDHVAMAVRLALAPDAELLAGAHSFLFVLARQPDDPVLWAGFGRLSELALRQDDQRLLERLRQITRARTPPSFLAPLLARLDRPGK